MVRVNDPLCPTVDLRFEQDFLSPGGAKMTFFNIMAFSFRAKILLYFPKPDTLDIMVYSSRRCFIPFLKGSLYIYIKFGRL